MARAERRMLAINVAAGMSGIRDLRPQVGPSFPAIVCSLSFGDSVAGFFPFPGLPLKLAAQVQHQPTRTLPMLTSPSTATSRRIQDRYLRLRREAASASDLFGRISPGLFRLASTGGSGRCGGCLASLLASSRCLATWDVGRWSDIGFVLVISASVTRALPELAASPRSSASARQRLARSVTSPSERASCMAGVSDHYGLGRQFASTSAQVKSAEEVEAAVRGRQERGPQACMQQVSPGGAAPR
eukprot:scaffold1205_cov249-Pinguiococcus_pyrenoidosus.AAC.1